MKFWKQFSSIIKKLNSVFINIKEYLKAEETMLQLKKQYERTTDSVYKKYENYYPQLFLEKFNFIVIKTEV